MSGWVRDRNDGDRKLVYFTNLVDVNNLHSCKLTVRHGKSTILMVFTRKDVDFHGRTVSFREATIYRGYKKNH